MKSLKNIESWTITCSQNRIYSKTWNSYKIQKSVTIDIIGSKRYIIKQLWDCIQCKKWTTEIAYTNYWWTIRKICICDECYNILFDAWFRVWKTKKGLPSLLNRRTNLS